MHLQGIAGEAHRGGGAIGHPRHPAVVRISARAVDLLGPDFPKLCQHLLDVHQMVVENFAGDIEEPEDGRIAHGVRWGEFD